MGLDMNLYKKTYVKNWDHQPPQERHKITIKQGTQSVPHIQPKRVCEITEEVTYWRKANQIHHWFVQNVQNGEDNCKEYLVTTEQLKELLTLIEKILIKKILAHKLLPVQSGFFFGNTTYDKYYFEQLKDTKEMLKTLLEETKIHKFNVDYYYSSSW